MLRKPENRELDILIINALARHRVLRRRTLAEMFLQYQNKKVYERLWFLYKKGIVEGIRYIEIRGKEPELRYHDFGIMHYLTPAGPRLAKDDLKYYEPFMLTEPPTPEELKYLNLASKLVEKVQLPMEDGRRFRCVHKVLDTTIDLFYRDWLIIYERDHHKIHRRILLKNCQLLSDIPGVKGIIILCKTNHRCDTLSKFWSQNDGPVSTHFVMRNDYHAISTIINDCNNSHIIDTSSQSYLTNNYART